MHPDLKALLSLQETDRTIAGIQARLRALDDQLTALDGERTALGAALQQARERAAAEEQTRRDLGHKVDEHRSLQQRNLAALDAVRKSREAEAAMSQIELTRRVLAQEESDMEALGARITEAREAADLHELELAELDQRQATTRAELLAARGATEEELAGAVRSRAASATLVSRSVLSKYERIRGRNGSMALYPLEGMACGRCHTAIPLQRRNVIAGGRSIEVCEGCGVLLYAMA